MLKLVHHAKFKIIWVTQFSMKMIFNLMVHTVTRKINCLWIASVWELEECFHQLEGSSEMTFQVKQLEKKTLRFCQD